MLTEFGGVRDMNLSSFDHDQAEFCQFVQDARKMFLRQVEAGRDDALVGRQRDGNIYSIVLLLGQFPQHVADDPLFAGV